MSFNVRIIYLQNSRIILQLHNPAHTILHLVSAKGFYSWDKAVFLFQRMVHQEGIGFNLPSYLKHVQLHHYFSSVRG